MIRHPARSGDYTGEPMTGLASCSLKRRARASARLAFLASPRARGRACQRANEGLHRLAGIIGFATGFATAGAAGAGNSRQAGVQTAPKGRNNAKQHVTLAKFCINIRIVRDGCGVRFLEDEPGVLNPFAGGVGMVGKR
jgi:hypothetical protein